MHINKILLLNFVFVFVGFGFAQTGLAQGAPSIHVSPILLEQTVNPSETVVETIKVTNKSSSARYSLASEVVDFYYDENDNIRFVYEDAKSSLDENLKRYSLTEWIKVETPQKLILPGETVEVKIHITAPEDALPGGHYATVFLKAAPLANDIKGSGASVGGEVGVLVLVDTPGDINVVGGLVEKLKIGYLDDGSKFKSRFLLLGRLKTPFSNGPSNFRFKFGNNSVTHFIPEGFIRVTNTFGKEIDLLKVEGRRIFPGTARYIDTAYERPKLFGVYRAVLEVKDKERNNYKSVAYFVAVPYGYVIATILMIGLLYLLLWYHERVVTRRVLNSINKKGKHD